VQIAVLRLHVVCPSVCLSVTLVDQDHIGWKSWKLIAATISPTHLLFVAQRPSTWREHGGNFGETRGRVEKVVYWSIKAAISLKRVKIEEKLPRRAYRNSPTLFRTVPSMTPYGLLFPNIGSSQPNPHPKLQSLLSQERIKLRSSNLAGIHSQDPSEQKPIKNFGEKGAWAYSGTAQFFDTPYYLRHG